MHPNLARSLEQASQLTQLAPDEICWAIEEYGHCSTDDFDIFPADDGDHYIVVRRPR